MFRLSIGIGLFSVVAVLAIFAVLIYKRKKHVPIAVQQNIQNLPNFKGLVLFDVDGTLTAGKENYAVVQRCLDNGWAVGICTAGAGYTMDNLRSFPWMPENLYNFIKIHQNITFNNVASGILCGQHNPTAYSTLNLPQGVRLGPEHGGFIMGYRKGFALTQTGKALGITDPKRLILFDDMVVFIQAVQAYNSNLRPICSGEDCGGQLTVSSVIQAISPS